MIIIDFRYRPFTLEIKQIIIHTDGTSYVKNQSSLIIVIMAMNIT